MCKNLKIFLLLIILMPTPNPNHAAPSVSEHKFYDGTDKESQIKGKVIDAETKEPIEFANIKLCNEGDSLCHYETFTDKYGNFIINRIVPGSYFLAISYIGLGMDRSRKVIVGGNERTIQLGELPLRTEIKTIGDIVVKAQAGKSAVKLDKTVVYAEDMPHSEGGTAVDVLRNLPSVSQTPSGQISIHGNPNFQVLINGKPTYLKGNEMLQYIPANGIFKVELIGNPSARYDASGTGGIINIITKNTFNSGITGNVNIAGDQLGGYSSDLLINFNSKKISFFTGIDHNRRKTKGEIERWTNNLEEEAETNFYQIGEQQANRDNAGIRTGLDLAITPTNKISLAGNIGDYQITNRGDWTSQISGDGYANMEENKVTDRNEREGNYGGAYLSLEHQSKDREKNLSLSGAWIFNHYDDSYRNRIDQTDGSNLIDQNTLHDKDYNSYQLNTDYSAPIGRSVKMESGYQLTMDKQDENYFSEHLHESTSLITENGSRFDRSLHAFYAVIGSESSKLEWKAGLRSEYFMRKLQKESGESYRKERWNFYPSIHSSLKINSAHQLSLSYSRRTNKLEASQIDPLPRWYDFYQVRVGNPMLNNEISDRISLAYNLRRKDLSFYAELYILKISDKIDNYKSTYSMDNIIQNTAMNVGTENLAGMEINTEYSITEWWTMTEKVDLFASHLNTKQLPGLSDKRYNQVVSFTTSQFRLSPNTQLEFELSYYSPSKNSQMELGSFLMMGMNFRQQFFKKKLSLTVTGNDIFGLYKADERYTGSGFNQRILSNVVYPVRFSLTYKINNFKREENRIAKLPPAE